VQLQQHEEGRGRRRRGGGRAPRRAGARNLDELQEEREQGHETGGGLSVEQGYRAQGAAVMPLLPGMDVWPRRGIRRARAVFLSALCTLEVCDIL
jgi:hypothetical protein